MKDQRISLERAKRYAGIIIDALREGGDCQSIAEAGSIRRERPDCGDIDLVVLPKPGKLAAVQSRCKQRVHAVNCCGDQYMRVILLNGIQLDLFFAHHESDDMFDKTPCNWGTLMLSKTGSKEFNLWFVGKAEDNGLHWNPSHGLYRGTQNVAAATEAEMFKAIHHPWIAPQERER